MSTFHNTIFWETKILAWPSGFLLKKWKFSLKIFLYFYQVLTLDIFLFQYFNPILDSKLKTLEGEMQNKLKIVKARKRQNLALSCDLN